MGLGAWVYTWVAERQVVLPAAHSSAPSLASARKHCRLSGRCHTSSAWRHGHPAAAGSSWKASLALQVLGCIPSARTCDGEGQWAGRQAEALVPCSAMPDLLLCSKDGQTAPAWGGTRPPENSSAPVLHSSSLLTTRPGCRPAHGPQCSPAAWQPRRPRRCRHPSRPCRRLAPACGPCHPCQQGEGHRRQCWSG